MLRAVVGVTIQKGFVCSFSSPCKKSFPPPAKCRPILPLRRNTPPPCKKMLQKGIKCLFPSKNGGFIPLIPLEKGRKPLAFGFLFSPPKKQKPPLRYQKDAFRFHHLPLRFLHHAFRYVHLPFRYVNDAFCFHHLPFRYLDHAFRFHHLPLRVLHHAFRYVHLPPN